MNNPLVSIIMGSDSDLPVVQDAGKILEEFGVSYETHVISAHRNPQGLATYVQTATQKGIKVFIAAAGGAAHLPGVIAGLTFLPVIGIPIHTKSLEGLDSLFSIVQMPAGVPVATVAINGAKNAGLLAIQILALSDKALQEKFIVYKSKMKEVVEKKSEELQKIGIQNYLEKMKK
ncbi:5-(carboxyamino)imidazole ribonucleotide mutase [Patescibacteria group bacterium]|nr:5-(carboxyamino)imidazole ribonucleotide mutase [Patescibacteria group bacterium]MBU4098819.1 5-(carboxyamino)imidazole ribonucleotide mutase [Patescibacteria group bacterium]